MGNIRDLEWRENDLHAVDDEPRLNIVVRQTKLAGG
jgi:hypothetical protein